MIRGRRLALPGALLAAAPFAVAGLPACPLLALTGLPCPACGGTRAVHLLLDGDPDFVRYNPFWALALVLAGGWSALLVWRRARGRAPAGPRVRAVLAWMRDRPAAIAMATVTVAASAWVTAMVNLETIRSL